MFYVQFRRSTEDEVRAPAAPEGPKAGEVTRRAHWGAVSVGEACPTGGVGRPASARATRLIFWNPSRAGCIVEERRSPYMPHCQVGWSGTGKGLSQTEELSRNRNLEQSNLSVWIVYPQAAKRHKPGTDIACFSEKVADLDQRLSTVEDHIGMLPEHDAELQSLREKITDLKDRSRRDNVRFFGIPEKRESTDIKLFLQILLPGLTGLTFSPPLKFQRVHRVGPPRSISSGQPSPIIVCFLRHEQAWQVLLKARSQGPFLLEDQEIRVAANFSKVTNEKCKVFLALRPQLPIDPHAPLPRSDRSFALFFPTVTVQLGLPTSNLILDA
ncbi:hypothetical protein NDU88_001300 [Pleurodeles waltl]|uniref:Uncharacterized protein n=1 Tax=Pleurodeles waltl TaxID=8319 RepID=A0AAV7SZ28_PLEWA|nr:hypothetical protein NDU88_001300 [Pleurodeles waltl]